MFRLAHLSDLHLPPLPAVTWTDLRNQRLLGYLSWRWRRGKRFCGEIVDALVRDLHDQHVDHVAITGDLTNLGLPLEFEQTAEWLRRLGPSEWVSLVPGNHDAYVQTSTGGWVGWQDYMSSDLAPSGAQPAVAGGFPFLRQRGPIALIGLSTAIPSPPTFATGRLGRAQLDALDLLLTSLAPTGCFRILLIHHPPGEGASKPRRRLLDAARLREIVARRGADLVLHGHEHVFVSGHIEGAGGPVPVIGVPSASRRHVVLGHGAQYHVFAIEAAGTGWRCDLEIRRFSAESGSFRTAEHETVMAPHEPVLADAPC